MRLLQAAAEMRPRLDALFAACLVEEPERREPDREVLLANCPRELIHQLQDEAAAFRRRAAVVVRPLVDVRAEELLRQIAVAGMEFDAIEADLHGGAGDVAVILDGALDMGDGQFHRRMVCIANPLVRPRRWMRVQLVGGVPDRGRGRDGGRAGHLRDCGPPRVPELAVDEAALGVHGVDDLLPAGGLLGEPEAGDAGHAVALWWGTMLAKFDSFR